MPNGVIDWIKRRRLWVGGGVVALVLLVILAWPKSVEVDLATATIAPMAVTIAEEGETRIRDVYQVSAPVSGRLLRVEVEPGDTVIAGETVVAVMEPGDPTILDERSRAQAEAQVKAATAARASAAEEVERLKAEVKFAARDFDRIKTLREKGTVSQRTLDQAELELDARRAALRTAQAVFDMRAYELATAEAALIGPDGKDGHKGNYPIKAPVSGAVLHVLQESETVLAAGTPIAAFGDPRDLEIVVDVLSADAVRIEEGATVIVTDWGGDASLQGRVKRVEPFGITKISALGIEEQRVNIVISLNGDFKQWERLGHGFRVTVNVVIWQREDALQVPLGALFRDRNEWAVMAVRGGRAYLTRLEVDHLNREAGEVLSGLQAGDQVVLHPGPQVVDGARVAPR